MAAGSRQSPVNIETKRAESDHEALSSKPLRWKYPATASRKLVNPGYCWRVDTDGEGTCECRTFEYVLLFFLSLILKTSLLLFSARSVAAQTTFENIRPDKYLTMIDDSPHLAQTRERKKLFFLGGGRGNLGLRLRSKLWIADHRDRKVRRKLRNRRYNTLIHPADGAIRYNFRRFFIRDTRPRIPS